MKVTYALVCDYATMTDGKPTYIGIFSRIFVTDISNATLRGFFVFGLDYEDSDMSSWFDIKVKCFGPSKKQIFAIEGRATPEVIGPTSVLKEAHQSLQMPSARLSEYGVYQIRLYYGPTKRPNGLVRFEVHPSADTTDSPKVKKKAKRQGA